MTQKERLVELLKGCPANYMFMYDGDFDLFESLADYLLSNGVIVPQCKVGDGIYLITKKSSVPAMTRIDNVLFDGDKFQYNIDDDMFFDFSEDDIGKTAFATYKEAEQVLKERVANA